jgi:hypothetical protein
MSERLLAGVPPDRALRLDEHLGVHGPLPSLDAGAIIDAAGRAGLTGRGGAAFPMAPSSRRSRRGAAAGSWWPTGSRPSR